MPVDDVHDTDSDEEVSGVAPELGADGCNNQLPIWGVTREFQFGQFTMLYDTRVQDGRRVSRPVVLMAEGDISQISEEQHEERSLADHLGQVPLDVLHHKGAQDAFFRREGQTLPIDDVDAFVSSGAIDVGGAEWSVPLNTAAVSALRRGDPVVVMSRSGDEDAPAFRRAQLAPTISAVALDREAVNQVIATGTVDVGGAEKRVRLDADNVRAILAGTPVVVTATQDGAASGLVRLTPPSASVPADTQFALADLAAFLADPQLPARDGGSVPISLGSRNVDRLRAGETARLEAGGQSVELRIATPAVDPVGTIIPGPWIDGPGHGPVPGGESDWIPPLTPGPGPGTGPGGVPGGGPGPGSVPPGAHGGEPRPAPAGLPLAVLLPWVQRWTLSGFSQGNLLSTVPLAPGEETVIAMATWERRSKTLSQLAETDTEQSVDVTSTTRDTEDVFSEMVRASEFQSQIQGSLDASYSGFGASVSIGFDGSVSNTESLTNTLRTTTQHLQETTVRAGTRIRARRVSAITESVEGGQSTDVVRRINNPNPCRTLTLSFREVLAHYDVQMQFRADEVKLVVLVPNPLSDTQFDDLTIRANESALQAGLLDPRLADGFEALRILASYGYAKAELEALSSASKTERENNRTHQTTTSTTGGTSTTTNINPHDAALQKAIKDVIASYNDLVSATIHPALAKIAAWKSPTAEVPSGQQWLCWKLIQDQLPPAFPRALAALTPTDVQSVAAVVSALPRTSPQRIEGLDSLSEKEKEDAGLAHEVMNGDPDWKWLPADGNWWHGECVKYKLYRVDDAGLASAMDRLRDAWQKWSSVATEAPYVDLASKAKEAADQAQETTTVADKLEMKYGVEVIASAVERREALVAHLKAHATYYRYVLFQSLPPGEQITRLTDAAPQLQVGMFEPRVVAMNGGDLAIPLSPMAATKLEQTLSTLRTVLEDAAEDGTEIARAMKAVELILPTPGVAMDTALGHCSGCEDHVEAMNSARRRSALAAAARDEHEAERLKLRLSGDAPDLGPPDPAPAALRIELSSEDQ